MKKQLLVLLALIILLTLMGLPIIPYFKNNPIEDFKNKVTGAAGNVVSKVSDKGKDLANSATDKLDNAADRLENNSRRSYGGFSAEELAGDSDQYQKQYQNTGYDHAYRDDRYGSTRRYSNEFKPKNYVEHDLRLIDKDSNKKLSGKSYAEIEVYNKGIYYSGYRDIDIEVISYDKYGDFLGRRYERFDSEFCKGESLKKKLEISRNTDEIVTYIAGATPFSCNPTPPPAPRTFTASSSYRSDNDYRAANDIRTEEDFYYDNSIRQEPEEKKGGWFSRFRKKDKPVEVVEEEVVYYDEEVYEEPTVDYERIRLEEEAAAKENAWKKYNDYTSQPTSYSTQSTRTTTTYSDEYIQPSRETHTCNHTTRACKRCAREEEKRYRKAKENYERSAAEWERYNQKCPSCLK